MHDFIYLYIFCRYSKKMQIIAQQLKYTTYCNTHRVRDISGKTIFCKVFPMYSVRFVLNEVRFYFPETLTFICEVWQLLNKYLPWSHPSECWQFKLVACRSVWQADTELCHVRKESLQLGTTRPGAIHYQDKHIITEKTCFANALCLCCKATWSKKIKHTIKTYNNKPKLKAYNSFYKTFS